MSLQLEPALLQRLRGSKLRARRARAGAGLGERRSGRVGSSGIEFAEYRDYQAGDEFRHVDRHVFARHNRAVVRQYVVEQQLQVTVLVDCSTSMGFGDGSKWHLARALTAAATAVGLFGGDRVRLGALRGAAVEWLPLIRNARGLPRAFEWVDGLKPSGSVDIDTAALSLLELTPSDGLLVIVSDWLLEGVREAVSRFSAARLEVAAIQVLAPEEGNGDGLGHGHTRLVDSESGDVVEIALDSRGVQLYRRAFSAWQEELRELVVGNGGIWLPSTSEEALDEVVLGSWRREGFIT